MVWFLWTNNYWLHLWHLWEPPTLLHKMLWCWLSRKHNRRNTQPVTKLWWNLWQNSKSRSQSPYIHGLECKGRQMHVVVSPFTPLVDGQCEDIGQNAGFANIDEDVSCPSNCHLQDFLEFPLTCFKRLLTWKDGESNDVIDGVTLTYEDIWEFLVGSSSATDTIEAMSAVGINTVIQNGTWFRQRCTSKHRNGVFVCLKNNQWCFLFENDFLFLLLWGWFLFVMVMRYWAF